MAVNLDALLDSSVSFVSQSPKAYRRFILAQFGRFWFTVGPVAFGSVAVQCVMEETYAGAKLLTVLQGSERERGSQRGEMLV